ncbi:hypothetical protein EG68_06175 [Paragonimus skrjabini miyazakii]|uniref:Uncharacterized protein n=1 Tax=Paragonimus skrjabini miyazakii TaxID=59628 RepID=A0A8S9YUL5_9TREM|nr:hypothetical protein EG68_06175 [Paragonimus skrjabini miyazakii]
MDHRAVGTADAKQNAMVKNVAKNLVISIETNLDDTDRFSNEFRSSTKKDANLGTCLERFEIHWNLIQHNCGFLSYLVLLFEES